MSKIIELLSGKKTFLCFGALVVVFVISHFGLVASQDAKTLEGILLGLGGLSMRAGMNK